MESDRKKTMKHPSPGRSEIHPVLGFEENRPDLGSSNIFLHVLDSSFIFNQILAKKSNSLSKMLADCSPVVSSFFLLLLVFSFHRAGTTRPVVSPNPPFRRWDPRPAGCLQGGPPPPETDTDMPEKVAGIEARRGGRRWRAWRPLILGPNSPNSTTGSRPNCLTPTGVGR